MRRGRLILGALLLAGCGTPPPDYWGVAAQSITIGSSRFDVRIKGDSAQAIRRSVEWAPRLDSVAPRAAQAIVRVSGCRVARLRGDAAVIEARLQCDETEVVPVTEWRCQIEALETRHGMIHGRQVCDPVW